VPDIEREEERIAEAVRAGEDGVDVPDELLGESREIAPALILRVRDMTVAERIKLALRGNREARHVLIHDPNRLIRRFVLQNPRITDEEVIGVAKTRGSDDDLLRAIAANREWTKNYMVRQALVTNPKTPLVIAIRLLGSLHERDLRLLAKSKNVSSAVAAQARRLLFNKGKPGE
jgi:hypothetical protein